MEKQRIKNLTFIFLLILGSILLLEGVFRIVTLNRVLNIHFLRIVLFSFTYTVFFVFLLRFFKPRGVKILLPLLLLAMSIFYFAQTIYYIIMSNFFSLRVIVEAGQGIDFARRVLMNLHWSQAIFFLPLLFVLVTIRLTKRKSDREWFDIRYRRPVVPVYLLLLGVLLMFTSVQTISSQPLTEGQYDYNYADRDLYDLFYSPRLTIDRFGLLTYAQVNLRQMITPQTDRQDEMDNLVERFLDDRTQQVPNQKSGAFEDKNLILVLAESLDTYSIDEHLMPYTSEMLESSWVFENHYAPPYYRYTADTEFMIHTSYYPTPDAEQNLSMYSVLDNTFPYTLPGIFNDAGYHTLAHHNYTDHFYPREDFHENTTGFDEYHGAIDMGLLPEDFDPGEEMDDEELDDYAGHPWPSDKEMMEVSLDNVLQHDDFFAYYLTVSGHLPYDENNPQAVRHYETIETIIEEEDIRFQDAFDEMSEAQQETMTYFHAAHYEFDQAMGELMHRLEDSGRNEDTVVMVMSDHFAYGIPRDDVHHYDQDKDLDESPLNMHKVPFFIYHPDFEQQHFEEISSSVDILPTTANLFNLEIDHNYIMGGDIFDPSGTTALFVDSDFIRREFIYDLSKDERIIRKEGADIPDETIEFMHNRLIHKLQMSRYILNTDYFGRQDAE